MLFLDGAFYGDWCQQSSGWGTFLSGRALDSPPYSQPSLALVPRSLVLPSPPMPATTGSHLPQINHLPPPVRASQCNQGAGKPLGHQGVKRLRQGK